MPAALRPGDDEELTKGGELDPADREDRPPSARGPNLESKGEIETAATAAGLHGVNLTVEQQSTYLAQLDELRRKGLERYKELGLDALYLKNERCREAFRESLERVSAPRP